MKTKLLTGSIIVAFALLNMSAFAEDVTLDPIVVSADFREKSLSQTTSSVTVIGEEEIYDKSSESFIEVLGKEANVNFSSGSSKAKFIQIRGMGEAAQFETPINPSVGLLIDGVDFSNITLGASLFDVKQIEILRGPQGTNFGANGLAGLVAVESNEPTKETQGHLEATVGNYNTKALGVAVGGTLIEDTLLGRISVYKNTSDGFIENNTTMQDDTNNIDELAIKAKLKWLVSDKHTVDFTMMHIDVDNGFDAYNQYNTRTTQSDEPGKDTQKTNAFSLKSMYQVNDKFHLESRASYSKSDIEYSYDEDWTLGGWNWWGNSTDNYIRDKKQVDLDLRLVSDKYGKIFNQTTDWIVGTYYKKYESDLYRYNTYDTGFEFESDYTAYSGAIYGQLDIALNEKLSMVTGLRLERWKTKYSDDNGSNSLQFSGSENLVGAKIGLQYQKNESQLFYATLSRGYKPGGFNAVIDPALPKQYQTEVLWNLDLGMNSAWMDNKLQNRTNFFYGKRKDQQVATSNQVGVRFTDYITNADKGSYYGLETEVDFYATDALSLNASLGLLRAKFDSFYSPIDDVSKDGRSPQYSPKYQYNIGMNYMVTENWNFKTNLEGKGSYYFENIKDAKSDAYALVNASLEYTRGNWSATVWGRNLTDESYQTVGYTFDNWFPEGEQLYYLQGDPRTFGFTLAYEF